MAERWSRFLAPLVLGLLALGLWEGLVRAFDIPPYLLPGPILILKTLVTDWGTLMESWWITMSISLAALAVAVVLGVVLAVLFASSKWIFPILSNTTVGLNSADLNLVDLFKLYRARWWQSLLHLKLPAAMPYFLAGLRISGGLSLIGAVVAEFVAGTGGTQSGLAYRILESGYQLRIPRMFAALLLISLSGILLFLVLSLLSHLCLRRWHESALKRET